MAANHLLSASLFSELFQHNLVSADGRIIASDQQLRNYSTFLIKQSKDRVASLHVERKNMVSDAEELLRMDSRTKEEDALLKDLLHELGLKYEGKGGPLTAKKSERPKDRYLGPKEPQKSLYERKIEADLERAKILKRDLRKLDDWLEQISRFNCATERQAVDWKEAEKKYRQRTANRICDMENARMKLVKNFYKDYDDKLEKILNRKLPERKYLSRKSVSVSRDARDSKTESPSRSSSEVGERSNNQKDDVAEDANDGDDRSVLKDNSDGEDETGESQRDPPHQSYAVEDSSETKETNYVEDQGASNAVKAGEDRTLPRNNPDDENETEESQTDTAYPLCAVEKTQLTDHAEKSNEHSERNPKGDTDH